jgi:hypothetical protein
MQLLQLSSQLPQPHLASELLHNLLLVLWQLQLAFAASAWHRLMRWVCDCASCCFG